MGHRKARGGGVGCGWFVGGGVGGLLSDLVMASVDSFEARERRKLRDTLIVGASRLAGERKVSILERLLETISGTRWVVSHCPIPLLGNRGRFFTKDP